MQRLQFSAIYITLLGCTLGCAAPKGNVASVQCGSKDSPVATLTESALNLGESSPSGVTGMQALRGYFDVEYSDNGVTQNIRCMMNLLPEVTTGRQVKIVTAGHCLPTLSKITGNVVKLKLQVFYRNGYIPLTMDAPNIDKVVNSGAFLNQYVVPLVTKTSQLGLWLPEYATSNCKKWTDLFKAGGQPNHKTACFSRQDLRIIDGVISEQNSKSLGLYDQALSELNRVKGAALSELTPEMSKGLQALWRAHNVDDMRKRNLRAMAYLANVQYCADGVITVNPADSQPDTKIFCQMRQAQPALLGDFFTASTSDVEFKRLQTIITDAVTPVQDLRDRYLGCTRTASSHPDEFTACEIGNMARIFFDQWVRDSKASFEALSATDKRGLTFADYFRIVAPNKTDSAAPQISILDLDSHHERNTLPSPAYSGGFVFDYDPAKNYFKFEKGDSGTALNIFSGFPVAVLSTIDGEPTSGGASITPLPEPQEEKTSTSPVSAGCR